MCTKEASVSYHLLTVLMNELTKEKAIEVMNNLGSRRIPFLFIIDFCMKNPIVIPLNEVDNRSIVYDIQGVCNFTSRQTCDTRTPLTKFPIPYERYAAAFGHVAQNIRNGNSYLLNLTFPTRIHTHLDLREIFFISTAKYKLFLEDRFVVFSPEPFVRIHDSIISSFPMKGTIDASIPNAQHIVLNDEKEYAEHTTIVDLIRNDLSMVATNVEVESFRYIEHIATNEKNLLQVSSKVSGSLPLNYQDHIGTLLFTILPAGSISGAPKKKTIEIILESEQYDRGYYTGVFGYFDGNTLDSGVMIRFIENIDGVLYYKSGGGITSLSKPELEYQEMIDKVYVPVT
jgi:para-aminobenzoate synthetase component 1